MVLSITQEPVQQLVYYSQLPENEKIVKIANLYAKAFAGWPWFESKACENSHFFGGEKKAFTVCTECNLSLKEAYPEKETSDYITKEISKPDGALITFEDERGEVYAAGWGYTCSAEELQAKYNSLEMREKVIEKVKREAEKVFYLSEIMVEAALQNQGIATKIAKGLYEKAQSINRVLVMRTRQDSWMVKIAAKMQLTQIIAPGEDLDNPNRVLYIGGTRG